MSAGVSPELLELIASVRRILTMAQGQVREIERAVAVLPQEPEEPPIECPHCGPLANVKSQARLEEHLANVHAEGLDEVQLVPAPRSDDVLAELFPAEEEAPSPRPAA